MKDKRSPLLLLLAGATLLLVAALIFRDFLFGASVLLYKDIGSDSLIDYYPTFVHLSDYIRQEGIPSWSFSVGMGQDLAYATGYLIWEPVSWLPRTLIAPTLIYQHLAKILIAGLLFFHFLQRRGLEWPASLLGSLLLSFSAYMCMGSCWYPFADEVVCFAALLLGVEQAVQRGRWLILAGAVAFVGMITPFHLYLCALFLSLYVPARLYLQHNWQPGLILRVCLVLAVVAILGVSLGAFVTLPFLGAILHSPRVSGATSAVSTLSSFPLFGLESLRHYATAILRTFANDMLGTGDDFHGWQNYLEAPLTYCGLFCLVVLPQAFKAGTRRHRIVFVLFVAALVVPTVFPWFRYLFWLFQGNYYRAYSLFCVLGIVTLSMTFFSRYLKGQPLSYWLLATTIIVLVTILYLPVKEFQDWVAPGPRRAATVFLILYGGLLAAGQLAKRQKLAASLIFVVAMVELIQFDRITVSNRKTVSKEELKAKVGYNDETVEAVRDIKASDSGVFRITKPRPSAPSSVTSLNDAMIFGYYGTSSYNSFNNINYINFLIALHTVPPNSEPRTRTAFGTLDYPLLSLFAGETYALIDDPELWQTMPQYEFVRRYGRDYLFRNALFLPLGLTYSSYMDQEEFLQLPDQERQEALLRTVILSKENAVEKQALTPWTAAKLEEDIRTVSLADVVAIRRSNGLTLGSFGQTRIVGRVDLQQKAILVVQTPFDRGWRALQDGRAVPTLMVDAGLLGITLDAGEHKVELHYRNALLVPAFVATLISLLVLGAGLWRWPRLALF